MNFELLITSFLIYVMNSLAAVLTQWLVSFLPDELRFILQVLNLWAFYVYIGITSLCL